MADGCEGALDRVGRSQVLPVLGGKVVEGEQHVAILGQTFDRLVVLRTVDFRESIEGDRGVVPGLGHPDVLERPLGFALQTLRQFVEDVGSLVHPAALLARFGPDLGKRLPEAQRTFGDREFRPHRKSTSLEIEQEFLPRLRALAHAVDQAYQLLLALRRRADDHEQALRIILKAGLHVDAVDPEVDVVLGGEIALAPANVFVRPGILEPGDGRGREPAGILAQQGRQRLLEIPRRDALQVENRDQDFEALRAPGVRRQNGRTEPYPLTTDGLPVAHARLAHGHRSDAGHDLALGQVPMTHDALVARLGLKIGISPQEVSDFRLDGLREQGTRPVAQNLSERIESPWLSELDDVSVGHGVSLLRWRSGGVEHPHDTPPYPFMPSPTFGLSSATNATRCSSSNSVSVTMIFRLAA